MRYDPFPYYLAGQALRPNQDLVVTNKYDGKPVVRVAQADDATIDRAIGAASEAAAAMRRLPAYRRQEILHHCVKRLGERREELAESLCLEAGKPIVHSRGEVGRLIETFRVAAEEAVRIGGETLDLEISPRARGYSGMVRRVPVGPCSFITPFNFPLNLVAHKVAPAIAAGCPFVLKPATRTPLGALIIGEILAETDLPDGAFSILPCARSEAGRFSTDERIKLLSFTGSAEVGWKLKAEAGKKRVALELGGNAACIVDEGVDLDDVVDRLILGAFYQSGQSCISVQRIIAHQAIYADLRDRLVRAAESLKVGDPRDEETFIGPLIAEREAERVAQWVDRAVSAGARRLCGGPRRGALVPPTLLENVDRRQPAYAEEIFGPVALLSSFSSFGEALAEVNDSRYGLQAGVFTRDLEHMYQAWEELEVGGVIVGDVPSWRVDHMPYGGVKDSGIGREGVHYAIEEMTERRLLVVRRPAR